MSSTKTEAGIINEYLKYIGNNSFPCIAAKAALARAQIKCLVVGHMACPADDQHILSFLYDFIDSFRKSKDLYHSATIIFKEPAVLNETIFDRLMWMRLQALSDLDVVNFSYDKRVESNPILPEFSFSLKEEAFFIIGLHPANSRIIRQFNYPALTFNPHTQFEQLRNMHKYEKMQEVVRKRDLEVSGSINPMLTNFGDASEVYQYSGQTYDQNWKCPLNIHHAKSNNNSAS
ncbi:MAG: YqcI/YcgG family protein [Sphingobacteriales bacterium]|nr:YqcI/YcgG family protein [Sphingobacteriales bacterium]